MTEHQPLNTSHLPVKLRVADYLLLDASGAFDDYRKTELIDGEVLYMNSQHRPHARVKSRLFLLLAEALRGAAPGLEAIVEGSVAMPPTSVPEPDIVVTSEPEGDGVIPLASVRLIVEVSDTTLAFDLGPKAALYAGQGVAEYWVVDVVGAVVHQLWSPGAEGYAERREVVLGERVEAVTIAGVVVETARV